MARNKTPKTGKYHVPSTSLNEKALQGDIHKDFNVLVKRYTDEGVSRGVVYDIIHDLSRFD